MQSKHIHMCILIPDTTSTQSQLYRLTVIYVQVHLVNIEFL